jgi:hypothetical protein
MEGVDRATSISASSLRFRKMGDGNGIEKIYCAVYTYVCTYMLLSASLSPSSTSFMHYMYVHKYVHRYVFKVGRVGYQVKSESLN